jgi:YqaJ-like viral recombinase domain
MMVPYFSTLQWKDRPQYSQLWTASSHSESEYVDSQFGPVPKGSLLSYQMRTAEMTVTTVNAHLPPALSYLDLSGYVLGYLPLIEIFARVYESRNIQTAAMKYGIEHEDEAAEAYANQTGRRVHRVGFVINPTCTFLGCSPDR